MPSASPLEELVTQGERFFYGYSYDDGKTKINIPKVVVKAAATFKQAADLGSVKALWWLGVCLERGVGVPMNMGMAIENYRTASEKGLPEAQYYLGLCLRDGRGLQKDEAAAFDWLKKSVEGGCQPAEAPMEEIGYRLKLLRDESKLEWRVRLEKELAALRRPVTLLVPAAISVLRDADCLSSHGLSHFGGEPYAEAGDAWPLCGVCKTPLTFYAQADHRIGAHRPVPGAALWTLFGCRGDCLAETEWAPADGGAIVLRLYADPAPLKFVPLKVPPGMVLQPLRALDHKPAYALPDHVDELGAWRAEAGRFCRRTHYRGGIDGLFEVIRDKCKGVTLNDRASYLGGYGETMSDQVCPQCGAPMEVFLTLNRDAKDFGMDAPGAGLIIVHLCPVHPSEKRAEFHWL